MIRRAPAVWVRWIGLFTILTLLFAFLPELPELRIAHGILVYLLLVVGVSRTADRWLTAVVVVLSYLAVDWLFVPPRRSLGMPTEFDLVVLLGFLVTSFVISQLVFSLQKAVHMATAHAKEIERLSADRLILERQAARAEILHEAERLKNALIASLTHDLRSPLSTLSMLSDDSTGIVRPDAMARIARETVRMNEYLSAMRKYAFPTTETHTVDHVEPHAVEDLISTARQSRERELADRDVRVHLPESPVLVLARCDFTLSLQILANLLENAARYSPPDTPIEVSVTSNNEIVEIAIADHGPGLTLQESQTVFEPLRRGDAGAAVAGGMGMGLAIARTFARAQHGNLWYRPRDGGGAEFVLALPSADMPTIDEREVYRSPRATRSVQ